MKLFIGLDLGLNKTAICAIDGDGSNFLEVTSRSKLAEIIAKLSKLKGEIALVGLEACPPSE